MTNETKSRLSNAYSTTKNPPITFNTRYKVNVPRSRSRDPSPSIESNVSQQTVLQRLTAARDMTRDLNSSSKVPSIYSRTSQPRSRDCSPASKTCTDKMGDRNFITRSYSNSFATTKTDNSEFISATDNFNSRSALTSRSIREKSYDAGTAGYPRRASVTSNYRSRETSPIGNKYTSPYRISNGREKSSDPSPSILVNKTKLRDSSPINLLGLRQLSREPSPHITSSGFSTKSYDSLLNKTKTSEQNVCPDLSISYMTAREANMRPSRPHKLYQKNDKIAEKLYKEFKPSLSIMPDESRSLNDDLYALKCLKTTDTAESSRRESPVNESKIVIQVSTITRATSPSTFDNSSSCIRRRDIARTIESVRQRPLQGPKAADKSTQSDFDTCIPRYSSLSPRLDKTSPSENVKIQKNNGTLQENDLNVERNEESPPKPISNKDFRKSILNIGPTDRRSKSVTPSGSSPCHLSECVNKDIITLTLKNHENSDAKCGSLESVNQDSSQEQKPIQQTKEEMIFHKIEEAKLFLMRTLGNPSHSVTKDVMLCNKDLQTENFETNSNKNDHVIESERMDSNENECTLSLKSVSSGKTKDDELEVESILQDNDTVESKFSKWSWINEDSEGLNQSLQKLSRTWSDSPEQAWWCKSTDDLSLNCERFGEDSEHTEEKLNAVEACVDILTTKDIRDCTTLSINKTDSDDEKPQPLETSKTCAFVEFQSIDTVSNFFISKHRNIDDILGNLLMETQRVKIIFEFSFM